MVTKIKRGASKKEIQSIFIDTNIAIYLLDGDRSLAEILYNKRL